MAIAKFIVAHTHNDVVSASLSLQIKEINYINFLQEDLFLLINHKYAYGVT